MIGKINLKKAAAIIMLITILVKFTGFLRDIILSNYYGASFISDAYLISLTIPSFIFAFISVSITTAYIPIYTQLQEQKGHNEELQFTNKLLTLLFIISTIIVLFGFVNAEIIVKIFASGFNGESLTLAVMFTKISIIGVYFSVMMAVFRGYLHVKNIFAIPAIVALPYNLIILISIYLSSVFENLYILAWGTLVGFASQVIIMIPSLYKVNYKPSVSFRINDANLKKFSIVSFPVILGVGINEINSLIDRTIASGIVEGAISALNYSFSLTQFVNGTFAAAIAIAMYPTISRMVINNNMEGLKKTISENINTISIIVIPITIILMVFSRDIISILYGRGAFDQQAIKLTSGTLFYYSIGILAYGYREILTRAFYSIQDSKTPMITAAISMLINIILNLILSRYMGTSGLALATSISGIIGSLLLIFSYKKKIADIYLKDIISLTLKLLIISLIISLIGYKIHTHYILFNNYFISLIITIIISLIIYIYVLYILRIKEVQNFIAILTRKFLNSRK